MRLQTEIRLLAVGFMTAASIMVCKGQVSASASNPGEYLAIKTGEDLINKSITAQTNSMKKVAGVQAELSASTTIMRGWEMQYNNYLKETRGYAQRIAATCQLYCTGVQTLSALWEVYTARKINPQGVFATMSMNNLYMEIATQFITTYRSLKKVVEKGGDKNMLNGAERTQLIWNLQYELEQLNKKMRRLAVCISVFSFEDVWNRAIAGKIDKSNGRLAIEARNRMKKAATSVARFYKARQGSKSW